MKRNGTMKWMIFTCFGLVIAGCSSDLTPTNAKLEKGLSAYLDGHYECLFPTGRTFPYEVVPGSDTKADKKQMDAMKAVGLLEEEDDFETHVARYTLTALGERVAPRFCYGHKVLVGVDGFTPPVKQDEVVQTTVSYHAKMMDVPVWAKTDELEAAFPKMAADISGSQPGQIVMATAGVGWSVR